MFALRLSEWLIAGVWWIPTIVALVDVLRIPTDRWAAAKQNQGLWVVLILLIPVVGPALYLLTVRRQLQEAIDN